MTAKEAFWLTRENSDFIRDEQGIFNACLFGSCCAAYIVYRVGDEVFTRAFCEADGFTNHKMPPARAKHIIETKGYAYSF